MKISQNATRIEMADVHGFVKMANPDAAEKVAITVNSNAYKISVSSEGRLDASLRATGLTRCDLLRGDSLGRIRNSIHAQYDKLVCNCAKALKQAGGTGKFAVDAVGLPEEIGKVKPGDKKINEGDAGQVTDEKAGEWLEFLQKNASKLDVFSKLRKFEEIANDPKAHKNATGWAGQFARNGYWPTMREIVRKHLGGNSITRRDGIALEERDINVIAQALHDLAHIDAARFGGKREAKADANMDVFDGFSDVVNLCLVDAGNYSKPDANRLSGDFARIAKEILQSMSSRQTGKLELQFCKARGIPLTFRWTARERIATERMDGELVGKWWMGADSSIHGRYPRIVRLSRR